MQPIKHALPFANADKDLFQKLIDFREWKEANIKGNERAEAQTFLNHFFKCFGYEGVIEAGGAFEVGVEHASLLENKGHVDCLFNDVALFEMKSAGEKLEKHYRQLKDYWVQVTPKPTYAILCNFDEFWIYDFNIQMGEPVQKIAIHSLEQFWNVLKFMYGNVSKPIDFKNNAEQITKDTVDGLKAFYDELMDYNKTSPNRLPDEDVQHFVLQCMLCMFAEDIGLMQATFFTNLVEECIPHPENSYELLGGLFEHMNNPTPKSLGKFKRIPYFNGGLFAKRIPIELKNFQLQKLHRLAVQDWSPIEPAIFGTIFERMIDANVRHAAGVHYTSELDIEKILRPTVTQYWYRKIQEAKALNTPEAFKQALDELREYRILDPACGSGNFLYKALIELKELEDTLIQAYAGCANAQGRPLEEAYTQGKVGTHQLFGVDVNHFAVELAKLTLEIGRKKAVDKLGLNETVLPLNNLQDNIVCADALFTPWPEAEAIVGNPPFLGSSNFRKKGMSDDYINKMFGLYPDKEFPNRADLCAYWFRKAQEHPAERCGLVATNSIAQGLSRKAGLDYIVNHGGMIHNAVSSQVWSGEAKVHVSLVSWVKPPQTESEFVLNGEPVASISSSLTLAESGLTQATRLKQNKNKCFEGVKPTGKGFIVSKFQAEQWIAEDAKNAEVLKPFISGDPITEHPELKPDRWIIDFNDFPIEKASNYREVFQHLEKTVKPFRNRAKEENDFSTGEDRSKQHWWLHGRSRPAMRKQLQGLPHYFAVCATSKWVMFVALSHTYLPANSTYVVASDDFYVLGVLNSTLHRQWVQAQSSTLEDRTRYTNTTCFDTFPFLWNAPAPAQQAVRTIAEELNTYRLATMKERNIGLTQLYNEFFNEAASQLAKLHAKLDKAVCEHIYGWPYSPTENYNPRLFALNQQLASAE